MFFRWLADAAEHQKFIDKLTKVKDAMGEWHDWHELSEVARELLNHGSECKLLRELKAVRDTKYCRALFLANEMRNTYLLWRTKAGTSERLLLVARDGLKHTHTVSFGVSERNVLPHAGYLHRLAEYLTAGVRYFP